MFKCPFCERTLTNHTESGWECECGELVPFGFEEDSEENCEICPVIYCPRRKHPAPADMNKLKSIV